MGVSHVLWDLLRYFRSLRGNHCQAFLDSLRKGTFAGLPAEPEEFTRLKAYLADCEADSNSAFCRLRDETASVAFCESLGVHVGITRTKSADHHQASKALVGAVGFIANEVGRELGVTCEDNPQSRAFWLHGDQLHVTARNLDGAMPALRNPSVVWEIKEYWGKTGGGSKMSDAVYESNLVGLELRHFEQRSGCSVAHVVFLDGKAQWKTRRSDMVRFIDLFHQGLVDELFIGSEVESEWKVFLENHWRRLGKSRG